MFEQSSNGPQSKTDIRVIVLDDDIEFCDALEEIITLDLGYTLEKSHKISDFRHKLEEAENQGKGYTIAIIDMNLSPENATVRRSGREALKMIKSNYPHIGCILASGITPEDLLKLRDNYGLDTFISKGNITPESLDEEIQKALQRIRAQEASKQSQSSIVVTLDFHIQRDGANIVWRGSLIGREETHFDSPYDDEDLPLVIRALDVLQYPNYPIADTPAQQRYFAFSTVEQQILHSLGLWQQDRVTAQAAKIVGQTLFNALGPEGRRVSKALRSIGSANRVATSYVLRFPREAVNLAALPWELTWDTERNQAVLIRGNLIDSCERYIDIDEVIPPPLQAGQRPHLLALIPTHNIPEDIRQREHKIRLETWDKLRQDNKITYDEISPLTMRKLNDYLLQRSARPDVIHYFGHGVCRNGRGYLTFDTEDGGKDLVSAERLAAVLGDVRLVVIHACQSAMVDDGGSLLTGVAPALSMETGAVVAMQLTVRIEAALRFSEVFYLELLSKGRSLQESVARARQVLYSESLDGASWYVPSLYIRSRESRPIYLIK